MKELIINYLIIICWIAALISISIQLFKLRLMFRHSKFSIFIHRYFLNHVHCKNCSIEMEKSKFGSHWIKKRLDLGCKCIPLIGLPFLKGILQYDNIYKFYDDNDVEYRFYKFFFKIPIQDHEQRIKDPNGFNISK